MRPSKNSPLPAERFKQLTTSFRLPTIGQEMEKRLLQSGCPQAFDSVLEVFEMEASDRMERRVERLLRASKLPPGKTFETLDLSPFPARLLHQFKELKSGGFVDRAENVLAFGGPGGGKTHVLLAIGHELVRQGCSVLHMPAFELVQELLKAKRDFALPRLLRKLDLFEAVILDDIGYIQQSQDEMEVLFTFLAERYERRSVLISSNLVFSQWDQIFRNPMTTAAAVDRIIHHCVILEFHKVPSYRGEEAKKRIKPGRSDGPSNAPTDGADD
jgi:DNA replication protein DnaC